MAMDNLKDMGFGKSDAQIAKAFGMSVSDFKKAKKQLASDISNPKAPNPKAPKPKAPKPTVKPTVKAKPKVTPKPTRKYTKSELEFLKGQKLKAEITKKTGVYPNTAN